MRCSSPIRWGDEKHHPMLKLRSTVKYPLQWSIFFPSTCAGPTRLYPPRSSFPFQYTRSPPLPPSGSRLLHGAPIPLSFCSMRPEGGSGGRRGRSPLAPPPRPDPVFYFFYFFLFCSLYTKSFFKRLAEFFYLDVHFLFLPFDKFLSVKIFLVNFFLSHQFVS